MWMGWGGVGWGGLLTVVCVTDNGLIPAGITSSLVV